MIRLIFTSILLSGSLLGAENSDPRLDRFFAKFPKSDLNGDGTLTIEEARQFRKQARTGQTDKSETNPSTRRASADALAEIFEAREFEEVKYRFFQPSTVDGERYPLILSLHGAAGRGTDNLKNLRPWNGILADPTFQAKHPCYVVVPQSSGTWRVAGSRPEITPEVAATFSEAWQRTLEGRRSLREPGPEGNLGAVFELLDEIATDYPIDVDRVYVLGHSMGGLGTFEAMAMMPERFAAAIPCAGGLSPWHDPVVFKDVPVWAFHGAQDTTVLPELTREVFEKLEAVGGNMIFTTLGGVGHGAADVAFSHEGDAGKPGFSTAYASEKCDRTENVWEWLFAQRRESRR